MPRMCTGWGTGTTEEGLRWTHHYTSPGRALFAVYDCSRCQYYPDSHKSAIVEASP